MACGGPEFLWGDGKSSGDGGGGRCTSVNAFDATHWTLKNGGDGQFYARRVLPQLFYLVKNI